MHGRIFLSLCRSFLSFVRIILFRCRFDNPFALFPSLIGINGTSHRPYYATTNRPAKLVHSRGDGLSSPRGGGCQARSQYKTLANFSPFTFLVTLTVTIERRK